MHDSAQMATGTLGPGAVTFVLHQFKLYIDLFRPNVINHTSMAIKLRELSKQRESSRNAENLMVVKRPRLSTCTWVSI